MESTQPISFFNLFFFLSIIYHSASSIPHLPKAALPTKSGYLPVNLTTGSAIFYTFYEAQTPNSTLSQTPLVIWLQGGPGCSSMLANFYELGPWQVSSHGQHGDHLVLQPNPGSWNRLFGLIFIDNPIGVGFSIASTPEEIPRDQNAVAKHLYAAIGSFIALDPSFKTRPIYITGESYAGKYVPSIGYYILKRNSRLPRSRRVNLAGVAIGNGLTDPEIQVATHAENAYFIGLIDEKQKTEMEKLQKEAIELVKAGNWSEATNARNRVLDYLQNKTGLATLYDYRRLFPYETSLVSDLLNNSRVKTQLGANESIVYEECSDVVGAALHEDVMKSVKYKVEYLVKKSRVLLYQGQFDLRDGVVSTEAWMKKMRWEGIEEFLAAERSVWWVKGKVAGYVQKWGNLRHVVVSGAGHLVPTDQPINSQAMIEDWITENGFFSNTNTNNSNNQVVFHGVV